MSNDMKRSVKALKKFNKNELLYTKELNDSIRFDSMTRQLSFDHFFYPDEQKFIEITWCSFLDMLVTIRNIFSRCRWLCSRGAVVDSV